MGQGRGASAISPDGAGSLPRPSSDLAARRFRDSAILRRRSARTRRDKSLAIARLPLRSIDVFLGEQQSRAEWIPSGGPKASTDAADPGSPMSFVSVVWQRGG